MELSEEEQLDANALLFLAVRAPYSDSKIDNIARQLDAGADINAADANYKKNSALHMAILRGEVNVIKLLLERQAQVNNINNDGKTPLDIAVDSAKDAKQEIIDILSKSGAVSHTILNKKNQEVQQEPDKKQQKKSKAKSINKNNGLVFSKRAGTSGACGQLYESKLLCLVFHRVSYAKGICEFYLATNINGIGALDDICLKYQIPGRPPVMLFLQAKHREDPEKGKVTVDDLLSADGDFSLAKYFDSYLRIQKAICLSSTDLVFKEEFEKVDSNFIIFTSAKDDFDKKRKKPVNLSLMSEKVNDLIFTKNPDGVFQFNYTETDVDYLVQIIIKEQIKQLGKNFMNEIMAGQIENSTSYESIMKDELIRKYHVILATRVLAITKVSETKTILKAPEVPVSDARKGHKPPKEEVIETRTVLKAVFRRDFFETYDELLCVLRDTFYREIVLTHNKINLKLIKVKEIESYLNQLIHYPSAFTVSNVIGNVIIFDEKTYKLKLLESNLNNVLSKDNIEYYRSELQNIQVTSAIVKEAIVRAGLRKIMALRVIPLPDSFGNKDMTVKERRIAFLEKEITSLMKKSVAHDKIIELNNEVDSRILPINGGIGGAVGNLLVLDENTKMLKFSEKILPTLADQLRIKLKENLTENDSLSYYRFKVNINDFPRISLHGTEYDKSLARDFLNKLYFYTGQGKENEIENIIKLELDEYYNADKNEDEYLFRIHTDAIFSRFHDDMQKWWMEQKEATYLTRNSDIFTQAKKEVVQQPVLTILNLMYINKVKKMGVEFNENVVSKMELHTFTKGMLNIITNANILSGIKVWQYFMSRKDYTFLDFDYVAGLPSTNYKMMMSELKKTKLDTLIILYETLKKTEELCEKVKDIVNNFKGQKIIVITDENLSTELKVYFPEKSIRDIRDDSNNMSMMITKSQNNILKDTRITYQGVEVPLETAIDRDTLDFLNNDILNKLLNNQQVEIGIAISDIKYDEVKNYYVDRHLKQDDKSYQVNTLKDIDENVVVVTAIPGMGKSTLLTHLSIETKKIDPKLWISRINLWNHTKEFMEWQQEKTDISIRETVKFICKASIKNMGNLEFKLGIADGKLTLNNRMQIDSEILLQLDLLIHFFNNGTIIFLFYGFEEICTHYEKEVILLLKNLKFCNQRIWVTTCPYSHTKNALERSFGTAYTLEPLTTGQQVGFFDRFWKTNLQLQKLNYDQFNSISEFFDYMSDSDPLDSNQELGLVPLVSTALHVLFVVSAHIIGDRLASSPATAHMDLKKKINTQLNKFTGLDKYLGRSPNTKADELAGTPMHMYIVANYFRYHINKQFKICLNIGEIRKKWGLFTSTSSLYERFLESNLKRLFVNETTDDLDEKDYERNYDRQRDYFLKKHKKLALFAICKESDLEKFMSQDEITEVKETIKKLETGEEKSEVVSYVLHGAPRFVHIACAEYFAVEYLTDLLKSISTGSLANQKKHRALWDFIINILLFNCSPSVRESFDYKLSTDPDLNQSTNTDECRNIIFEIIKKQNRGISNEGNSSSGECSAQNSTIEFAVSNGLKNLTKLFTKSLELNTNCEDIDKLVKIFKTGACLMSLVDTNNELDNNVLLAVQSVTKDKVCEVLSSDTLAELPAKCFTMYSESDAGKRAAKILKKKCEDLPFSQNLNELGNLGLSLLFGLTKTVIQDPDPKPSSCTTITELD